MSDESYAMRTLLRVNEYAAACHQRIESDGDRALLDNLSCLYAWLADAVAAQSREFRHYLSAQLDAESERDELRVRVQELEAELVEARSQADSLVDGIDRACRVNEVAS